MQKALFSITALLFMGLFIQSCKKDTLSISDTDKLTAEDLMAHNDLSEQLDLDASEALDNFSGELDERSDCPTVTYTQPQGTWPNTITLDYSDSGCTKNGRTYKGKVTITQTNPMSTPGATRTFAFDQFFIEGVQLEGSKTVTLGGLNSTGLPYFTIAVDETLTYPNGTQATYTSSRVRTLVEGFGTSIRADDVWNITGTASGVNRNGKAYTSTITSPLVKKALCAWISAGTIEFVINEQTRSLDFGDGTCDRDATLTLADGTEKDVTIRHFWWR